MLSVDSKIDLIKRNIKTYPDFMKPGVLFRDIFGVFGNPEAAKALEDLLKSHCSSIKTKVDAVCALESRGFLLGPLMALHLQVKFVPIRKKGKLPGDVKSCSYDLEYGSETIEIQTSALAPGSRVLLVDDLIATGGSLKAGCELISAIGSEVDHCFVVIELDDLKGRENVPCPVTSLINL